MNTYSDKGQLFMEIKEIAESIAKENKSFDCLTKCVDTIDKLCEIVRKHCGYDYYVTLKNICDRIIYSDEYEESEDVE